MSKLSFDDVMEMLSEERHVDARKVSAAALDRIVWIAEWHLPGCLSESRSYCVNKRDAIATACSMAENENGAPHGMKTHLRKRGRFDSNTAMYGTVINTVSRHTLSSIL